MDVILLSPHLLFFFFPSTAVLHLHQALAEELEQKLSASHNRGLDSTETCQEGSQTPKPVPAKRKPIGSTFLFVTFQPSPDPAVQQKHLRTFLHPYRQHLAALLYFFSLFLDRFTPPAPEPSQHRWRFCHTPIPRPPESKAYPKAPCTQKNHHYLLQRRGERLWGW